MKMNRLEELKGSDFKLLKKLCDENGFELITESPDENDKFFVVKKKDIWEGVEFFVDSKGIIRKIKDETERKVLHWFEKCKPSTEQAYIEQLKKEAFERFGEIKEGDRFNCRPLGYGNKNSKILLTDRPVWGYKKERDELDLDGFSFYKQGKWVERVKERVTVDPNSSRDVLNKLQDCVEQDKDKFIKFLAEQLEKYLNNEI